MYGRACLIRFADDAVMGFESERDARRVLEVLPKRFARYGLTLHPTKTRLVKFVRPPWRDPPKGSGRRCSNGSFDFLGFTHYGRRSQRGSIPWPHYARLLERYPLPRPPKASPA